MTTGGPADRSADERVFPGTSWQVEPAVEAAGFSRAGLDRVVQAPRALPTTSFMVVAGGRVVLEYGDVAEVSYLASARKSVLSTLYGRPVADGVIDLDRTMADIGIDDVGGLLPIERTARVADLLTSRSGVYHPAATPGSDEANLPARGAREPGTHFVYNNWDFNTLDTIFERLTGRGVFEALRNDLAVPLGFEDFDLDRQHLLGQPERSIHLAHHMFLSCRDLARIGLLMVRGGRWAQTQVVPPKWVARSTSSQADLGPDAPLDYGYLWWVPRRAAPLGSFVAIGNYGQHLLCVPELDLVVAHRRAIPDDFAITRNQTMGATSEPAPEGVGGAAFLRVAGAVLAARTPTA